MVSKLIKLGAQIELDMRMLPREETKGIRIYLGIYLKGVVIGGG